MIPTALGNIVGGGLFVGAMYWVSDLIGHVYLGRGCGRTYSAVQRAIRAREPGMTLSLIFRIGADCDPLASTYISLAWVMM